MLRERDPLRVLAWVLLALLGVATLAAVLWLLRAVFVPVMLSLILAYCLAPVVGLLQRRRVPRAASAAGLLVLVLGAFVLFLALFIPALQEELQRFAARLPRYLADARGRLEPLLATWGLEVPASLDDVLRQFGEDVKALVPSLAKPLTSALRKALSSTISLVVGLTGAVMVPLFAFYFLRDWERIVAGARDLIPAEHREAVVSRLVRFDEVLGGFLRGQLTVGLILGVFYAIGLTVLGVRLGWMIGLVAGLLNLVPYLGVVIGLLLSMTMALLAMSGGWTLVGVAALFGVAQVLEGFVLTPRIVGERTGLGDVQVILALLVGGELFGFLGVLLAVPVAAVLNVLVQDVLVLYRRRQERAGS